MPLGRVAILARACAAAPRLEDVPEKLLTTFRVDAPAREIVAGGVAARHDPIGEQLAENKLHHFAHSVCRIGGRRETRRRVDRVHKGTLGRVDLDEIEQALVERNLRIEHRDDRHYSRGSRDRLRAVDRGHGVWVGAGIVDRNLLRGFHDGDPDTVGSASGAIVLHVDVTSSHARIRHRLHRLQKATPGVV